MQALMVCIGYHSNSRLYIANSKGFKIRSFFTLYMILLQRYYHTN